jgi:hypothetical protein
MANSIQEFHGRFASLNDLDVIAMIHLAMDAFPLINEDKKISEIIAEWGQQIKVAGPGTIDLMLEGCLKSYEDKNSFFCILNKIRNNIKNFHEMIPAEVINKPVAMGVLFNDYPIQKIQSCLDDLENLVR